MAIEKERVQTVVIGGGQAGLSAGYYLAKRGLPFVILDAEARTGDVWRRRWNSLRLFTPARYDSLPGMAFPAPPHSFPTKDQMAGYLEAYAARFDLPVRHQARVLSLTRESGRYIVTTADRQYEAEHVIVAMSPYQKGKLPAFAQECDPEIRQMHSLDYRGPEQLKEGGVLVVGAGNSGAEIAIEAARNHRTWLAGRDTGHVPFRIAGLAARLFLQRFVFRFVFHRLLTIETAVGRKAQIKMSSHGAPLIRTRPKELAAAGVIRGPRVTGVRNGLPVLADGRILEVANIIWCTGFNPGFSWIQLPVFDERGIPKQHKGTVAGEPGLYFIGLPFTYSFSSAMIHGVGRDAERVVSAIAGHRPATHPTWPRALAGRVAPVSLG